MTPFSVYNVLGVDLGQTGDPSAAVLLSKKIYDGSFIGPPDLDVRLRDICKYPLGTDYNVIVDSLLSSPIKVDAMVVDFTGVGRPVVDLLRKRAMNLGFRGKIIPVVIAASNVHVRQKTEARGQHWVVPKCDLISAVNVLGQSRSLHMPNPKKEPLVKALLSEMRTFQQKHSDSGNLQMSAKSGKKDDMVLSFSLAAWWMLRYGSRKLSMYQGGQSTMPVTGWQKQGSFSGS